MILEPKAFEPGDDQSEVWIESHKGKRLTIEQIKRLLRRSKRFKDWKPPSTNEPLHRQYHYSPIELGRLWNVSADMIRKMFEDEDDVLLIGDDKGTKRKRRYRTMQIPEGVAARVHKKFSNKKFSKR